MRELKRFFLLILITLCCGAVVKAESVSKTLKVGQKIKLYPPSTILNQSGFEFTGSWSCDSKAIKWSTITDGVEVEVLSYTDKTIYLSRYYKTKSISGQKFEFNISITEPYVDFSANPSGGKVNKGTSVSFNCWINNVEGFQTSDVKIYYRLDGYTPNQTDISHSLYDGVTINETCTLKAIAVWKGVESAVLTENYIVDDLYVSASPKGGKIKAGTVVRLSCDDPNADIHYTLNGSTPTQSSTRYTSSGIIIEADCTVKAIAYKDGKSGGVMTEKYIISTDPTSVDVYVPDVLVGKTVNAQYTLYPSNAESSVTWSSDDPSIATVGWTTGIVTGKKVGSTTIRCKTANGVEGACSVKVYVVGVTQAVAGYSHTVFTKDDGSLWGMGRTVYDYGLVSNDKTPTRMNSTGTSDQSLVVSIAAGDGNVRFVTSSGYLYGCGSNDYGQLSDAKRSTNSSYRGIMKDVLFVSGKLCSHIIKKDGSLWACGLNREGNLGDGTTKNQSKPVHIMDDVAYVSSGGNHTLIIKKDNSLWACGWNYYGQLGDGTTTDRTTPVKIMDDVAFASAGGGHSLIIKSDGSLWACGNNSNGQLCDGTTVSQRKPKKIMDGVSFVEASNCSYVVKNDGSLWGCGENSNGELGIGSWKSQPTLVKIMDNVKSVSSSGNYTVIVKKNGSLWACGKNDYGQLGDGTTSDRSKPVEVVQGQPETAKIHITASPSGGEVLTETKVTIESDVSDAIIYYTLDGSTPTKNSTKYTSSGISINESCTLKAIAFKDGYDPSDVLEVTYTIKSEPTPTSISVNPSSKTIKVGDSFTANYTLTPSDATTTVKWTSDDKTIATVDESTGKVTGINAGTTYINATTANGKSDRCKVSVKRESIITINPASITIKVGESFPISYTLNSQDNDITVSWSSSFYRIAWVTSTGLVVGCAEGKTFIVAKTSTGDTATCEVTVESISKDVEINSGNFPDDNFRNYILQQDYGKDGILTEKELNTLDWLNFDNLGIRSLKGIDYFVSLQHLSCNGNQLSELDLSKNRVLNYISCRNNQLTKLDVSNQILLSSIDCRENQIDEMDVSNNTELKLLHCDNNQLTSLDVSNNTGITTLNCYNNQITSLNVSKNTALTHLECYSNQLTTLDVSKNTALTYLHCSNNELTSLDISNNTELKELSCYKNQLTSLDFSNNTVITSLDCWNNQITSLNVSKNTALTRLNCSDNQLTTLDVSKSTAMTFLNCSSNQLKSLDVSKNTALTHLSCYSNKMTSLEIPKNAALMYLDCSSNQLKSLDVSKITALNHLSCSDNQLKSLDVSKNTALTYLSCSTNQLTSLDVSKNTALTYLFCNTNQLTSLVMSKNSALTDLYCYTNQLTSLDVSNSTALTILNCSSNLLTSLDVSKNTVLTTLSCSTNQLTSLDVTKNTALTKLYCSSNLLTSLDLSKNINLETIGCGKNKIYGSAMDNLVSSLPENKTDKEHDINILYADSEEEGNVCTAIQVDAIKAKGWVPYEYDSNQKKWIEYAGSDSSGIGNILTDSEGKEARIYTISGQRIEKPQKGINIIDGKKVVVK